MRFYPRETMDVVITFAIVSSGVSGFYFYFIMFFCSWNLPNDFWDLFFMILLGGGSSVLCIGSTFELKRRGIYASDEELLYWKGLKKYRIDCQEIKYIAIVRKAYSTKSTTTKQSYLIWDGHRIYTKPVYTMFLLTELPPNCSDWELSTIFESAYRDYILAEALYNEELIELLKKRCPGMYIVKSKTA